MVRVGAALPKLNILKGTETVPELAGSMGLFLLPFDILSKIPTVNSQKPSAGP